MASVARWSAHPPELAAVVIAVLSEEGGDAAARDSAPPGAAVITVSSDDANSSEVSGGKVAAGCGEEKNASAVSGAKFWAGGVHGEAGSNEAAAEEEEEVCRICHLSPESAGLMRLGCGCKNELGAVHQSCAEAWFRVKGNRYCEICGLTAKNIKGDNDTRDRRFFNEFYEMRRLVSGSNRTSERISCWRSQPFCNFLMVCLLIAFILPWFVRVKMF